MNGYLMLPYCLAVFCLYNTFLEFRTYTDLKKKKTLDVNRAKNKKASMRKLLE